MTDKIGKDTLEVISEAEQFNHWMYQTIKPFVNGKVLEIGSGIGNISSQFLSNKYSIMLSDFRHEYCDELRNKFAKNSNLLGVTKIDLVDPGFEIKHSKLLGSFDTVFALNVLEHIQDDLLAISNCRKLLKIGGSLIILVPSYQGLFNKFDVELGHFIRYTIPSLKAVFEANEFKITHTQYFNFVGTFGWYLNGNLLKKKTIPEGQMKLYNKLVPLFKIVDKALLNKVGLSTIVIGQK